MENDHIGNNLPSEKGKSNPYLLPGAIVIAGVMVSGTILYTQKSTPLITSTGKTKIQSAKEITYSPLEEAVLPKGGVVLPVTWGELGKKLIQDGVIDGKRFGKLYEEREQFTDEYKKLLLGNNEEKLTITRENAGYLLNLLWALGLANKNPILDTGEMKYPRFGGPQNFASTAGWTMSIGNPMDHYSRHKFLALTAEEQALVDKISKGIYRPCCGNSTHFPDCNHGMAMLGLLELMASQGASEAEMWEAALAVNSYWFPDTYVTIAAYMKNKGIEWEKVDPKEVLGAAYSSRDGFSRIAASVTIPVTSGAGGSGCDVSGGLNKPTATQGSQSGCGI